MKRLRLGFMLGLAILIVDMIVPVLLAQRVVQIRESYQDAATFEKQLAELLSAYKDLETGQRGFMITGVKEFLEPYDSGRLFVADILPEITRAAAADPVQSERVRVLLEMDKVEADYLESRVQWRLAHHGEMNSQTAVQGKELMDGLRKHIAVMRRHEQARMDELMKEMLRIESYSHSSIVIVTSIGLLLFVAVYWVAMRATRAQDRDRRALEAANDNLNAEVLQRTGAVEQLQRHTRHLNEIVDTQTQLVQSQLNIEVFLEQVVQRMLTVTTATGAVIEMIHENDMIYEAVSGSVEEFVGLHLPRVGSLSGLCVDRREMLIAADTRTDPRVNHAACERVGAASMVVAPLLREGEPIGVLKIVSNVVDGFDATDLQTLQLMSGLLGAALGHQLQFEKNRDLLAERNITLRALRRELQRHEEYEIKLIAQRHRTENILEASHEAFICIDKYSVVREWNAQAARTFGWSKEEALGRTLDELIIPPRYHEAHHRGIEHFLKTGEGPVLNRHIELPALRRDGKEIPLELTITMQRDGDRVEFPCFLRDISERKRAEAVLVQQQATLRALTDAIPALVSFVDLDERYQFCNRQYLAIFGIEPEAMLGRTLQDFLGDELYWRSKPHIDAALAGQPALYERTIQTRLGMRHQECRHIPQTDDTGRPSGFYLTAWDITERKTQELEWQSRASIDHLTGLLNRAAFEEMLALALQRHQRNDAALALLYLDVDRFKHINDTYGHAAGDVLLKKFAECLQIAVRATDFVARLGGDEFCIVLDNIKTPDNSIGVAEKILELVRAPLHFEGHTLTISTSIGIAFVHPPNEHSATLSGADYIARADAALYQAKQAGRNGYVLEMVGSALHN
jgi:diguanylate cyclase (GGDEF)-like protein/PAS domain S-box-containing protein